MWVFFGVVGHETYLRQDPGPWIIGLNTEARYTVRPSPEVCVCDM
jgi:hypothetical protein